MLDPFCIKPIKETRNCQTTQQTRNSAGSVSSGTVVLFPVAGLAKVFSRDAQHASVAVGVRIVAGNAGELVVNERKRSYRHGGNDADLVLCWRHSIRVAFDAELGKRFFQEKIPSTDPKPPRYLHVSTESRSGLKDR